MPKKANYFYFGLFLILKMVTVQAEELTTLEIGRGQVISLGQNTSEIFVANPEIADVQLNTPSVAYLFGKKIGTTTVFATDVNGKVMIKMDVNVTHNISDLKRTIQQHFPDEQIQIFSVPQGIVLQGSVKFPVIAKNIEEIAKKYLDPKEQIINNLSITNSTQVLLKVKIAEVSRSVINKLNINWSSVFEIRKFAFGFLTGNNPLNPAVTAANPNLFANNAASDASNGIGFRFADGNAKVASLIDALDQEGLASILAEPNLIALSGETASFLSGGEYPYPVPQDANLTIEFKQFGVNLSFTPTVSANNLIHLKVRPEVSQLDPINSLKIILNQETQSSAVVPGIKVRRAETSVQLGSGQSLAIAGLISSDLANTYSELPGFADIPVIGALFGSSAFKKNQSELVIIVTPYIVEPASDPKALKLPTDTLKYASTLEMFFKQRLNRIKGDKPYSSGLSDAKTRETESLEFVGAAGFVVEE